MQESLKVIIIDDMSVNLKMTDLYYEDNAKYRWKTNLYISFIVMLYMVFSSFNQHIMQYSEMSPGNRHVRNFSIVECK